MAILIDNFSMDVGNWSTVSEFSSFLVDVTDGVYTVSTSGTYFLHDGVQVSTTYSGIPNGYRFSYTPLSVVSSGTIDIGVHAVNSNNDTLDENYYLLYGYNVKFTELVDWGVNSEVLLLAKATTELDCPNTESLAFSFTTADLTSRDLSAIVGVVEAVNLPAEIYSQSTAFFYGSTYTVTVSGVKDFSGNVMDSYQFTFTIEDPQT